MKKYFQTWHYVSRIKGRVPFIGKPIAKTIQFICGIFGHELSKTEWGYGGGEYADRWCRWCNKLIQVPKTEIQFAFKDAELMKHIGLERK
uniref:Uncharacterized protein n=1 Tax=viral metagenome TaxID=1070528 RepID=A0A6M3XS35_9ZZZZ